MKGYPFETPEIEIARDGVYGCSSEHTPKIHWLHLILRNADGTQMGFCGIDEVLEALRGSYSDTKRSFLVYNRDVDQQKPSSLSCGATSNS